MTSYRKSLNHGVDEICDLLRAVDRHLGKPATVVIIGGAAAAFHHAQSMTADIDTHESMTEELAKAIERANAETGLDIPMSDASISDVPYNFEDRLEPRLPELEKLAVRILEKHDLALSKVIRGFEHDLQQLEEIHQHDSFDFDILVERFRTEMATWSAIQRASVATSSTWSTDYSAK